MYDTAQYKQQALYLLREDTLAFLSATILPNFSCDSLHGHSLRFRLETRSVGYVFPRKVL